MVARDGIGDDDHGLLSPKEKEVLLWVRHGRSNAEIAMILAITQRTVKFHLSNIMQKLRAENRTHAVAIATRKGLFDD